MTLAEYLEKIGKRAYPWAQEVGVHHTFVYRHIAGKRVSYETALLLSKATGGKVKAETIYRVGR